MKNRIINLVLFLLPVISLIAQPIPPDGPGDQGEDAGGPGSPIDQYLIMLAVVALFVAGYYIWKQRKLVTE